MGNITPPPLVSRLHPNQDAWHLRGARGTERGQVAPGDCSPGAPANPYVPFRAYGLSYHELATGRLPE